MHLANTKKCSKCKLDLTIDCFFRRKTKSGFRSSCKSCEKSYKRPNSYYHRLKETMEPEAFKRLIRAQTLRAKYGINVEEYDRLLVLQDGRCAICNQEPEDRGLFVDHDHTTNTVRSLLCSRCNSCLERIERDPDWGSKAIAYLNMHKLKLMRPRS